MKQQGEMIFSILKKEPKFWKVPIGLFDVIINSFAFFGKLFPNMEDAAELGYYCCYHYCFIIIISIIFNVVS